MINTTSVTSWDIQRHLTTNNLEPYFGYCGLTNAVEYIDWPIKWYSGQSDETFHQTVSYPTVELSTQYKKRFVMAQYSRLQKVRKWQFWRKSKKEEIKKVWGLARGIFFPPLLSTVGNSGLEGNKDIIGGASEYHVSIKTLTFFCLLGNIYKKACIDSPSSLYYKIYQINSQESTWSLLQNLLGGR